MVRRVVGIGMVVLAVGAFAVAPVAAQSVAGGTAQENAGGLARPRAGATASATPPPPSDVLPAPLPPPLDASHMPDYAGGDVVGLRLDALDDQLQSLAARRSSGVGDGIVAILLGGTYIGLGYYASQNEDGSAGISTYFYLSGAGSLASAAVHFGLQPNPERAYSRFQALEADTTLTPSARLRQGEHILHSMAKRRMAARYIQAGIGLSITVGSLPSMLGGGFDSDNAFDWAIVASSGISVVSSIMTIVQRSEEERRWRIYRTYAENHGGDAIFDTAQAPRLRLDGFAVAPSPTGGHMVARFIF